MLQLATNGRAEYNVFRSTQVEEYAPIVGAVFCVAPGTITNCNLQQLCTGADGLLVLYKGDSAVLAAETWLRRISGLVTGIKRVPVLVCCTSKYSVPHRYLCNVLQEYPMAEHTHVCVSSLCGTKDCVNRIVYRVRKEPPSPLAIVKQLTESC